MATKWLVVTVVDVTKRRVTELISLFTVEYRITTWLLFGSVWMLSRVTFQFVDVVFCGGREGRYRIGTWLLEGGEGKGGIEGRGCKGRGIE